MKKGKDPGRDGGGGAQCDIDLERWDQKGSRADRGVWEAVSSWGASAQLV